MWNYEKRLEYPINIKRTDAAMAKAIISQFGGPDGETGAAMRYLSQRFAMPYRPVMGVLTDVGIEASNTVTCKSYPSLARSGFASSKISACGVAEAATLITCVSVLPVELSAFLSVLPQPVKAPIASTPANKNAPNFFIFVSSLSLF